MDLDRVRAIGERVMRPRRPRLHEAVACVTGAPLGRVRELVAADAVARPRHGAVPFEKLWSEGRVTDPRAAWERAATAGLVPMDWPGAEDRQFVYAKRVAMDDPPSLRLVVALASDAEGVAAAEQLAREAVARLAPWWKHPPAAVAWRMASKVERPKDGPLHRAFEAVSIATYEASGRWTLPGSEETLAARRAAEAALKRSLPDVPDVVKWRAVDDLAGAIEWAECAAAALTRQGIAFRDLPSPFEALLALWGTGYAFEDVSRERVTLVVPEL